MDQITIRRISAELPVFDEEAGLEPVSSLGADGGLVSGFRFGDASLRAWDVDNATTRPTPARAFCRGRPSSAGFQGASTSGELAS